MNRLAHWMMRLYPSRWRKRYGDELEALLADTGADASVVADLASGGIRMQFSTWSLAKLAVVLGFGSSAWRGWIVPHHSDVCFDGNHKVHPCVAASLRRCY